MSGHRPSNDFSWQAYVQDLETAFDLARSLDELAQFRQEVGNPPAVADRWILVSNLHKTIRLSRVSEAVASGEALFRCDAPYFWRQLPVIALEDVSFGDLRACIEVLRFTRDLALRRRFGDPKLAGYLSGRLAGSVKSRSACDLLSLVIAQQGEARFEAGIKGLGVEEAFDLACSPTEALRTRALALLRLDRLHIRYGDQRAAMLRRLSDRLELPILVKGSLLAGKATQGLGVSLPLILELLSKGPLLVKSVDPGPAGEILKGPILCSAVDQHTRSGQKAIRQWVHSVSELSHFFRGRGLAAKAERITRMALFHIEGSVLDRRLTNDCLDLLLEETERAEMCMVGLTPDDAAHLYSLMRRHHAALNLIRRALWAA